MSKITESRKNLQAKDAASLQTEVKALQKAHFGLRMQKATQQLNNTATLRSTITVTVLARLSLTTLPIKVRLRDFLTSVIILLLA